METIPCEQEVVGPASGRFNSVPVFDILGAHLKPPVCSFSHYPSALMHWWKEYVQSLRDDELLAADTKALYERRVNEVALNIISATDPRLVSQAAGPLGTLNMEVPPWEALCRLNPTEIREEESRVSTPNDNVQYPTFKTWLCMWKLLVTSMGSFQSW